MVTEARMLTIATKTKSLQDPGTPPARRQWMSIDLGTEIYKDPDQVAEWTVSDFDILVPKKQRH